MTEMTCKCITIWQAWMVALGPETLILGTVIGAIAARIKFSMDYRDALQSVYYTTDGGKLAPYPGMTDAELADYERAFK